MKTINKNYKFWWIDNFGRYGVVKNNQVLSVKHNAEVDVFDNETDWKKELQEKYNIDAEEDDVELGIIWDFGTDTDYSDLIES